MATREGRHREDAGEQERRITKGLAVHDQEAGEQPVETDPNSVR